MAGYCDGTGPSGLRWITTGGPAGCRRGRLRRHVRSACAGRRDRPGGSAGLLGDDLRRVGRVRRRRGPQRRRAETRYLPIGLSVASALHGNRAARLLRAQLVVDESWAIGHLGGGRYEPRLLFGAGLILYSAWVAGTAIGVAAGDALGRPEDLGLDAAFPALFLALLAGQVRGRRGAAAATGGALVALALVPFGPVGLRSWPPARSACWEGGADERLVGGGDRRRRGDSRAEGRPTDAARRPLSAGRGGRGGGAARADAPRFADRRQRLRLGAGARARRAGRRPGGGGVAIWLRAPLLAVVVVAAVVAALVRLA